MTVDSLLESIPPLAVYLVVGLIIGIEILGIPLPGETALVSAALLASRRTLDIDPMWNWPNSSALCIAAAPTWLVRSRFALRR